MCLFVCLFVCLSVCPLLETPPPDGLKTSRQRLPILLILAKYKKVFFPLKGLDDFLCFEIFLGFGVFSYQPTVHSGGVSRGRVCGFGCAPKKSFTFHHTKTHFCVDLFPQTFDMESHLPNKLHNIPAKKLMSNTLKGPKNS